MKCEIRQSRRVGEDGEWVLVTEYYLDGAKVSRQKFRAACPDAKKTGFMASAAKYPIESVGLGVHPSQIKAAEEAAAKKGVKLEFTKDGKAILRDRGHRRDVLRATGYHDHNGGYGDG